MAGAQVAYQECFDLAKKAEPTPAPGTEVAPAATPNTAVATMTAAQEEANALEAFAGFGMEGVTSRDVLIPRVTILQDLSPQVKPKKAEYIEGAKIGDICDVAMGEIFEAPFHVLPVAYTKNWLEWGPRTSDKGLVAIHPTDELMAMVKPGPNKEPFLPNGNLLIETAAWYCLNLDAGRRRCFIPFSSTGLKRSRKWMTLAQGERLITSSGNEYIPPLFYRTYVLSTAEESKGNNTWHTMVPERGVKLTELPNWQNIMKDAAQFRDQIASGAVRADLATDDPADVNTIDGNVDGSERRM